MARQSEEVTKLLNHFKNVGFSFAKSMKAMVRDGSIKPPNNYSIEEYCTLIDIAYDEGMLRTGENNANKKQKINEANTRKSKK